MGACILAENYAIRGKRAYVVCMSVMLSPLRRMRPAGDQQLVRLHHQICSKFM